MKGEAMKLPRRSSKRGRVEIIPLIDTVLILLIFYMSFSTFKEKEQSLPVPLPFTHGKAPPPVTLSIQVLRDGNLTVNGATFDPATLRDVLSTMASADPRTCVTISAEPAAKYQAVIRAVDICAQAKLTKVAFQPLNS
jgi:biopolymer transport protein ExbD